MSQNYDFKNLSPIDFEELCRDLLQKELCITFESFTEGKDGGIDFRYLDGTNLIILQCKRFTKENFSSLETELKKELSKVKKINPTRYILMTSFGLTPLNEQEILSIFSPYILSTSDIYGKNDINNLLGKFEDIEKKYPVNEYEAFAAVGYTNMNKIREKMYSTLKTIFNTVFSKKMRYQLEPVLRSSYSIFKRGKNSFPSPVWILN